MDIPVAVAGNKLRMDVDMSKMFKEETPSMISTMVVIGRGDKKMGFTLYPNAQRYTVSSDKEESAGKPRVEKERTGSETINGHRCDRYKVRIVYKNGKVEEGLIWNAKDLDGMTIKSEVENNEYRVTSELRNIVLKTPASYLFEIPAGYTEASTIMEIMAVQPGNK